MKYMFAGLFIVYWSAIYLVALIINRIVKKKRG